MIRPEAAAILRRWAEPALALAVTTIAVTITGLPQMRWGWASVAFGVPLLVAGLVWLRLSVRRALRGQTGEAAGRVFMEERRVLYLGPYGNVQADLDEITRLDIAYRDRGLAPTLLLVSEDGPPVALPVAAEGIDAVFDALAGLPGLTLETIDAALSRKAAPAGSTVTIWRRSGDGAPSRLP